MRLRCLRLCETVLFLPSVRAFLEIGAKQGSLEPVPSSGNG
jgi:hypothetical protein